MLVEKVWKAARTYGREGYTVVIHGKSEHEETKATFSNTRRHAPAVIVRNLDEVRALGECVLRGRSWARSPASR
jgi:4-hydroxy-3-methylbut-2-enyl diphosphate reductase